MTEPRWPWNLSDEAFEAPLARIQQTGKHAVELRIAIQSPNDRPRQLVLAKQLVRIGRIATADIRLTDARVNDMHAIIDATAPDSIWIIDLGSSHGTFVNGKRINKARLNTGDQVALGGSTIDIAIGTVK